MSVHTVSSAVPIMSASPVVSIVADCGKVVTTPQIAFVWDGQLMDTCVEWAPNVCRKCRIASDNKTARYVYGVTRGEEAEAASA